MFKWCRAGKWKCSAIPLVIRLFTIALATSPKPERLCRPEPSALRVVSDVLPLSYAVDAMRTITTSAEPDADVALDVLIVLGFVVAAIVLAAATFRRRTP